MARGAGTTGGNAPHARGRRSSRLWRRRRRTLSARLQQRRRNMRTPCSVGVFGEERLAIATYCKEALETEAGTAMMCGSENSHRHATQTRDAPNRSTWIACRQQAGAFRRRWVKEGVARSSRVVSLGSQPRDSVPEGEFSLQQVRCGDGCNARTHVLYGGRGAANPAAKYSLLERHL